MRRLVHVVGTVVMMGCSSAAKAPLVLVPAPVSADGQVDSTYGYSEANPIKVGGVQQSYSQGPRNEQTYLRRLRGPEGQKVRFQRQGSCCPFETAHALVGDQGFLDAYEVTYAGLSQPVVRYLNFYDADTLRAPVGFVLVE